MGKIHHQKFLKSEKNEIITENDWVSPKGELQCSDTTHIKFMSLPNGGRGIDYKVTLRATNGDVKFGDTKEGSLGIRTHPALRMKGKVATGKAINNNGISGDLVMNQNEDYKNFSIYYSNSFNLGKFTFNNSIRYDDNNIGFLDNLNKNQGDLSLVIATRDTSKENNRRKKLNEKVKNHKLITIAEYFDVSKPTHSAKDDVITTFEIYKKLSSIE